MQLCVFQKEGKGQISVRVLQNDVCEHLGAYQLSESLRLILQVLLDLRTGYFMNSLVLSRK